ncbi:inositol polyphosphate multikinase [Lingula anatina]|uniref:Kinase n=1 Tax=Lingula anatina TaxID=7574 RepID=A0A1S3HKM9_LINAN|nr:inositol polyphosphate multikinase [Lingula anatina]|eukprot:XP_013386572.1 inositol polyphosphate multikinase [Lingula anatina]
MTLENTLVKESKNEAEELESVSEKPLENDVREKRPKTPPLPKGTQTLEHQVAGHRHGKSKTKLGFLQNTDGTVLKAIQSPPRGMRELQFYQNVFDENQTNSALISLRQFMPKYLGTYSSPELPNVMYLVMEKVTQPFAEPCVCDLKMGARTHDPEATPAKIAREKAKYPFLENVGFQFQGYSVYDQVKKKYDIYDKKFGRSLTEVEVLTKGFAAFFDNGYGIRVDAVKAMIKKLEEIEKWFMSPSGLCFYASSLLLVYDGERTSTGKTDEEVSDGIDYIKETDCACTPEVAGCVNHCQLAMDLECPVAVKMIDFAHVFPASGLDENYLTGLRSLIAYLHRVLEL